MKRNQGIKIGFFFFSLLKYYFLILVLIKSWILIDFFSKKVGKNQAKQTNKKKNLRI